MQNKTEVNRFVTVTKEAVQAENELEFEKVSFITEATHAKYKEWHGSPYRISDYKLTKDEYIINFTNNLAVQYSTIPLEDWEFYKEIKKEPEEIVTIKMDVKSAEILMDILGKFNNCNAPEAMPILNVCQRVSQTRAYYHGLFDKLAEVGINPSKKQTIYARTWSETHNDLLDCWALQYGIDY